MIRICSQRQLQRYADSQGRLNQHTSITNDLLPRQRFGLVSTKRTKHRLVKNRVRTRKRVFKNGNRNRNSGIKRHNEVYKLIDPLPDPTLPVNFENKIFYRFYKPDFKFKTYWRPSFKSISFELFEKSCSCSLCRYFKDLELKRKNEQKYVDLNDLPVVPLRPILLGKTVEDDEMDSFSRPNLVLGDF